ncbi:hypothetical protein OSB04_018872 [Centaurea solstitialis]|uniref:Reverse transcriptase domain-containing protein n=1 Tax=Centaurea solstitialis TaxID=347529 RepID=A0AA38SP69_9ASTR|nr:hypothetical protein OSB04_018872 [Centaurea solstitialis]
MIKSTFKEKGIDSPIELAIMDNRIRNREEALNVSQLPPIFSKGIPLLTYQSNENVLDYQVNLRRLDLDIEDIKQRLKQCYTENPLQFWDKNQITAKLEMKDKEKEIRVKPMRYNPEDQKEFMIQTKELLDLKLIRISHSPHSSPAFMIFSKFDCKSGFWQIKMHLDSILYTSFSTPQGQYEWFVMPFGLKNAPQIFQRKIDTHRPSIGYVNTEDILEEDVVHVLLAKTNKQKKIQQQQQLKERISNTNID